MVDTAYYIKFIVSSLFVIGILMVVLRYAKKIQQAQPNKHMKIVDRLTLGNQSHLFIIDIKGVEYVIGSTNQHIHMVDKL